VQQRAPADPNTSRPDADAFTSTDAHKAAHADAHRTGCNTYSRTFTGAVTQPEPITVAHTNAIPLARALGDARANTAGRVRL
jgi:hypothetical protein